jgi:carbon-monoxide dehydrogenase large subunit
MHKKARVTDFEAKPIGFMQMREIKLTVNGQQWQRSVSPRLTLSDFLRDELGLKGTHVGCEHGACGACTVLFDGEPVCSCLMLAVQTNGHQIATIEGLAQNGEPSKLQDAFHRHHALQCGFCTPGVLMNATAFLRGNSDPTEQDVREALRGNLCRCTGYKGIVQAVLEAAQTEVESPAVIPEGTEVVGVSIGRHEDQRLLRGEGTFTSDIKLPNLAHAVILRSPYASARIKQIDTGAARSAPGILAVLTFEDIAAVAKPFPQVQPHPALVSRMPYPLAKDVVRYAGEPVAIVVAEDVYQAEDARELIDVQYEESPAAVDPEAALQESAPLVHDDVPCNRAGGFGQEVGDVETALEKAFVVIKDRFTIGRVSAQSMETRAITASYESGKLTCWMTTQSPHMERRVIAEQVNLPPADVHVIAPDIGGGFGPKNRHYSEYTLVPMLAMQLGRPVAWREDRRESFTASYQAREQVHEAMLALAADGTILALADRFVYDQGAYTPIGIVVPYVTSVSVPGPYRVPNYRIECAMAFTNKTPTAPYRGAGKPQAAYVMERLMDLAAYRLDLDPIEIRRRNLLKSEEFPYHTGLTDLDETKVVYDSGNYHACLDRALELINYKDFPVEQAQARRAGRRIGVGVACYSTMTGRGPFEGARVRVATDGKVYVYSGVSSQGQSHQTTLAQICADHLGVRFSDVVVKIGDSDVIEKSIGTYAARVLVMAGNAVAEAAKSVRDKVLYHAARLLETPECELTMHQGMIRLINKPEPCISLGAVAEQAASELETTSFYHNNRPAYANGTYAAVVEVCTDTGTVKILRHVLAHDCGVRVNPQVVDGQIYGGVAQGIGEILLEEVRYDETGKLLTNSLRDYLLPTTVVVPPLVLEHLQTPSPFNPLGVKGAGEGGVVPVAPAITAAIENALDRMVQLKRKPIRAEDLLAR